jgi:hypothetical protein
MLQKLDSNKKSQDLLNQMNDTAICDQYPFKTFVKVTYSILC